ncbi:MAG: rhodanese-like domain-containing protein [Bacteroidales bacterium]
MIPKMKGGDKKMKRKITVLFLALTLLFSISTLGIAQPLKTEGPPKIVKDMVAKAKAEIKKVSPSEVKAALDKKEKAVILDVRDPNEYAEKIYVYCKTGARSALATKTLKDLGYKNAILMDASFEDWIKAGYPVVR